MSSDSYVKRPWICKYCGKNDFTSPQQLGGHSYGCKLKHAKLTPEAVAFTPPSNLSSEEVCAEILMAFCGPTIKTSSILSILEWHTTTKRMMEAIR